MKRVYVSLNSLDAYLVLHRLQHAGISAHVFNEHMQSIAGDIPPDVASPQIWLDEDVDYDRALRVLDELRRERKTTGSVSCKECHEENPINFELCWSCGRALPV